MPGRGGADIGEPFKLLYYHCNTTKIDRVEQCRGVPSSAGKGWADIGEALNYSTTIAIPLK